MPSMKRNKHPAVSNNVSTKRKKGEKMIIYTTHRTAAVDVPLKMSQWR